ncbi:MAG: glycerol-3-phosphate acyltransferase [Paracoccaceae bacterium]
MILLFATLSYVIGSVPLHRLFGLTDIDQTSSTHAFFRALLRFLLNVAKGFVVVYIAMTHGPYHALVSLFFIGLGHNYPIWTTFKGGTGLGTFVGGLLAIEPTFCVIAIVLWSAGFYVFQKTSAAAITTALLTPLSMSFIALPFPPLAFLPLPALVLWRHRVVFAEAFECPAPAHLPLQDTNR